MLAFKAAWVQIWPSRYAVFSALTTNDGEIELKFQAVKRRATPLESPPYHQTPRTSPYSMENSGYEGCRLRGER